MSEPFDAEPPMAEPSFVAPGPALQEPRSEQAPQVTWSATLMIFVITTVLVGGGNFLVIRGHMQDLLTVVRQHLMLGELAGAVWMVGVISALRWWPIVGGVRPRRIGLLVLPAMVVLVIGALTALGGGFAQPFARTVAINTLLIGIVEELFFRGVLLQAALRRFSASGAVMLVAVLFGIVHVSNAIFTGDLRLATAQAGAAMIYGLWSTALRYETGSILPLIAIHWAWDGLLLFAVPAAAVAAVLCIPVLLVFGIWLLRDIRRREAPPSDPPFGAAYDSRDV